MSQSSPPDTLGQHPQLVIYPASSEDDQISALRLIADSVAQQRQIAAKSLISHPLCIAAVVALISFAGKYQFHGKSLGDLAFLGTTGAGCLMIMLAAVQWMTGGYLEEASRVGTWKWLRDHGHGETDSKTEDDDDVLLVTKYGDELIGTILLQFRHQTDDEYKGQRGRKQPVFVRAWTVKRRYRQRGIGTGLLEEALAFVRARGLDDVDIVFDVFHANSFRVLPRMFNAAFERREKWAQKKLEEVKKASKSPT